MNNNYIQDDSSESSIVDDGIDENDHHNMGILQEDNGIPIKKEKRISDDYQKILNEKVSYLTGSLEEESPQGFLST